MQTLKLVVLFGWITVFSCAQKPREVMTEKLSWLSLEEVAKQLQQEKKPVLIDLYTDWCGWCKVMDKRTYANKNVSAYLQQKFYPVKLDAETRKTLSWKGKNYSFNDRYRTNEFAVYLTNGNLSYPTTVIIPVDGEPQAIPGFLAPNEFELVVKYFGEGHYGKTPFDRFQQQFRSTW